MAEENINETATTNLTVVTASALEDFGTLLWSAVKQYLTDNVDASNLVTIAKGLLDLANREVIGTTLTEKSEAILNSINALVDAFETIGYTVGNITTAEFAELVLKGSVGNGIFILDTDNVRWTAENWVAEKERTGQDPAVWAGIIVVNEDHNFLVGTVDYGPMQFGTRGFTIPNLEPYANGLTGTPKDGTFNCRMMTAAIEPYYCRDEYKCFYETGMDLDDLLGHDVIFFENSLALADWYTSVGLGVVLSLPSYTVFAYPYVDNDIPAETNWKDTYYWVTQRFNNTAFVNICAKTPYKDNLNIEGIPPITVTAQHKEYPEDTNYWRIGSIFELVLVYLNKPKINECRVALGKGSIQNSWFWSCCLNDDGSEWYYSLADGSVGNLNKGYQDWVLPVAS